MLEALKFVMRGVARRDYVPGLTHFRIKNGRCTGYNGQLALSAPVDIGFDVAPQAGLFIRALNACEDVIALKMEGANLLVRSGKFQVLVPCIALESVPTMVPEGRMLHPHASLLAAFETLEPFVGIDASRPWAMGVLLANQSAFATNNIIISEYWLGAPFPAVVNIPSSTIAEVVRIHEEMVGIQVAEGSVTFHYKDGRWIKSPVLELNWPDVPRVLSSSWADVQLTPITVELRKACDRLSNFCDVAEEHLYFRGTEISTHPNGIADGGAVEEIAGFPHLACFHKVHLGKVLAAAQHIDFSKYPQAVPFTGGAMRGAMLGVRM